MSKITTVIAGDSNFRKYVDKAVQFSRNVGYDPVVYDLGGLGYGIPFKGRVSPQVGAKIPSKPGMIMETLKKGSIDFQHLQNFFDETFVELLTYISHNS